MRAVIGAESTFLACRDCLMLEPDGEAYAKGSGFDRVEMGVRNGSRLAAELQVIEVGDVVLLPPSR